MSQIEAREHDWTYESDEISTFGTVMGSDESDCERRVMKVLENGYPDTTVDVKNLEIDF